MPIVIQKNNKEKAFQVRIDCSVRDRRSAILRVWKYLDESNTQG